MAGLDRGHKFDFTRQHFVKVRGLLYDHAGIVLADHKQDMAYNRLARRLRELRLDSFDAYLEALDASPMEFGQFINAMTTNLTAFFREKHHFDFVRSTILPEIEASGQKRLRGWSAGCSLGEETYSLAIAIKEAGVNTDSWDIRLLATDINSKVLHGAQSGVYELDRVKTLSDEQMKNWFLKGVGKNQGCVKVRQELQQMITFRYLNLMDEWPFKGPFDFIFCRNVMIYFDKDTQMNLLERMAAMLKPGGYLFVGHSETLARKTTRFRLVGHTIYKKA
ncbi:MAG: chemotaxis protein CheR [Neptuniibacter caesariensis]|uniref:Chemotaxis protein methyltransferase n=1 Tax=Neptuniibacter caesariensis TaxID=207954 RepID=A0A2G6JQ44_NEPCE|nr:MAG: chemotaxis protein CheR [Neptuniibacter caesariensis]